MTRAGSIVWRFVERSELRAECGDVASWLSEGEQQRLARRGSPASREASALARVALKQLVLAGQQPGAQGLDPQQLELVAHDALGRGVRPRLLYAGRAFPWSVSISHTETAVLVAVGTQPGVTVGVDLVADDLIAAESLMAWFDPCEEDLVAAGGPGEIRKLWAIKEAVYKAANQNDSFAPRRVCLRRASDGRYQAIYRGLDLAERCRIETVTVPDHVAALVQVAILGGTFAPLVEYNAFTLAN